ncbi:MAG TPA: hypothetical protein VMU07_04075 [Candidatus Paceibacterota bacterium]|nr:hypothetical protein [Candidatus Paceibacterota bacterium]
MNVTDVFKLYAYFWEAVIAYSLIQTVLWGRASRVVPQKNWDALDQHRHSIGTLLFAVGFLFVGIETARMFFVPELNHHGHLYFIHMTCGVSPAAVFLTLSLYLNGKGHPRLHRFFTYPSVAALLTTIVTGHVLISTLHGKLLPSGWLL